LQSLCLISGQQSAVHQSATGGGLACFLPNLPCNMFEMKATTKLLLAIGAAAATGLIIYAFRRHQRHETDRRLDKVADEGYETAHDILFPDRSRRKGKLQYGR
jgi:hypothetical protein